MAAGLLITTKSHGQPLSGENQNKLTAEEKNAGWVLLFDGKTSAGWRGANKEAFPEKGWKVEDGMLIVTGEQGGDMIMERQFVDFDRRIEFKVTEQKANK